VKQFGEIILEYPYTTASVEIGPLLLILDTLMRRRVKLSLALLLPWHGEDDDAQNAKTIDSGSNLQSRFTTERESDSGLEPPRSCMTT
jgi:hypothetical protein